MTQKNNFELGVPSDIPLYRYLGAHTQRDGRYVFRVYAPNADRASLCADFCGWEEGIPMKRNDYGIWEVFAENVRLYDCYKYKITQGGQSVYKADPFAFHTETSPKTASKIYDLSDAFPKEGPLAIRQCAVGADIKIYKVNLELWNKKPDGNPYSYREAACILAPFIKQNGYTHIEIEPICEYFEKTSYYGNFTTGIFAPTPRFGTPRDFADMIDFFHGAGIGVILQLPFDTISQCEHGLCRFDGTALLEEADVARFNVEREDVSRILVDCADFWVSQYTVDGIRIMRRKIKASDECFFEEICGYMKEKHPNALLFIGDAEE